MRLVQLKHPEKGRRVALVEEPYLIFLSGTSSVYELSVEAIRRGSKLSTLAGQQRAAESILYDEVYAGDSAWELLPAFDHPHDPLHCMLSGTGLTHKASAEN